MLNLPQEITYSDRHIVRYKYAADGRKLRTEYLMSMVPIINRGEDADSPSESDGFLFDGLGLRDPIGGGITPIDSLFIPAETTLMVRDYCGNHIYRDRVLKRINNDYGYWADGNWYYYVKDYQGNVRAVINHAGSLKEVNNYYPYGALMGGGTVGNNQSVQPYKYGTKELDRQNGLDLYDFEARLHDQLLGRTPTMDSHAEEYYPISPYVWCGGNPMRNIDPDGNIIRTYINGFAYDYQIGEFGYVFYDSNGIYYDGNDAFVSESVQALGKLQEGQIGGVLVSYLMDSENIVELVQSDKGNEFNTESNQLSWNPTKLQAGYSAFAPEGEERVRPAYIGLGHELAHVLDFWLGTIDLSVWVDYGNGQKTTFSEIYASNVENELRKEHSIPVRTHYSTYTDGTPINDSYIRSLIPSVRHTYPFGTIFHQHLFNNW